MMSQKMFKKKSWLIFDGTKALYGEQKYAHKVQKWNTFYILPWQSLYFTGLQLMQTHWGYTHCTSVLHVSCVQY